MIYSDLFERCDLLWHVVPIWNTSPAAHYFHKVIIIVICARKHYPNPKLITNAKSITVMITKNVQYIRTGKVVGFDRCKQLDH